LEGEEVQDLLFWKGTSLVRVVTLKENEELVVVLEFSKDKSYVYQFAEKGTQVFLLRPEHLLKHNKVLSVSLQVFLLSLIEQKEEQKPKVL
jgi:hypothetical protein